MSSEGEALPVTGTLKWFDAAKGYGFISPPTGGSDVFLHVKELRKAGIVALNDGASVSFTPVKGPKGLFAIDISIIPAEA
jgi:CspA family cold shock protein